MCYSQNNRAMDFDFYCVYAEPMCVCVSSRSENEQEIKKPCDWNYLFTSPTFFLSLALPFSRLLHFFLHISTFTMGLYSFWWIFSLSLLYLWTLNNSWIAQKKQEEEKKWRDDSDHWREKKAITIISEKNQMGCYSIWNPKKESSVLGIWHEFKIILYFFLRLLLLLLPLLFHAIVTVSVVIRLRSNFKCFCHCLVQHNQQPCKSDTHIHVRI